MRMRRALLAGVMIATPAKGSFEKIADALGERIPALKGAELIVAGHKGQQPRTVAMWGTVSLAYRAAGFRYRVDLGAFFQVNRWLVDALIDRVTAGCKGALAWDLFAGVGLFARRLASSFDRVVAVESAPAAMAALEHNLGGTTSVALKADALAFLRKPNKERPDLIVVDPPRMGLGAEITEPAGGSRGPMAGLRFMRSSDAGARSARVDRLGLRHTIHYSRRPVSADVPSGNCGAVTTRLIGLGPEQPFIFAQCNRNRHPPAPLSQVLQSQV